MVRRVGHAGLLFEGELRVENSPVEKENDILEAALDEADGWSGFRIGRSGIWGSPDLVDGEPGGSFE